MGPYNLGGAMHFIYLVWTTPKLMKKIFTLALALAALSSLAQTKSIKKSPPLTEATPASAGMSAERLSRIDTMINDAITENKIPGAVALVARNGRIVYYKAFGKASNSTGQPLKRDDIFRIASQSKAITATAVMMLWEEGKFSLDDPISKYIPEFAHPVIFDSLVAKDSSFISHPATKPITIRNLLTHTSGIGYGMIDDDNYKKIYQKAGIIDAFTTSNATIEQDIKRLAKLPLHFEPGSEWHYSEGLDVLGYFIEKISGMPFDKFLQERIFTPLEMHDTYFYLPDAKKDRLVPVQTLKDGKWIRYTTSVYDIDYPVKGARTYFSGGGGLSSTAVDYAHLLQMYLNGGEYNGIRLLSRATVQFMMENQIGDLYPDAGGTYALAFCVINEKGEAQGGRGHAGTFTWGGYFDTQYFADPREQVIGIIMKQVLDVPNDDTGGKFDVLVEQAIDD